MALILPLTFTEPVELLFTSNTPWLRVIFPSEISPVALLVSTILPLPVLRNCDVVDWIMPSSAVISIEFKTETLSFKEICLSPVKTRSLTLETLETVRSEFLPFMYTEPLRFPVTLTLPATLTFIDCASVPTDLLSNDKSLSESKAKTLLSAWVITP